MKILPGGSRVATCSFKIWHCAGTYLALTKADQSCQVFRKSFSGNELNLQYRRVTVAHTVEPSFVSEQHRPADSLLHLSWSPYRFLLTADAGHALCRMLAILSEGGAVRKACDSRLFRSTEVR